MSQLVRRLESRHRVFTVAYLLNASPGLAENIQVRQYNPATQTWGANLAAGPAVTCILSVRTRANGDILCLWTPTDSQGYDAAISIYSAGAWEAQINLSTFGNIGILAATMALDSAGQAHIVTFETNLVVGLAMAYHRIKADNTLGVESALQPPAPLSECTPSNIVVSDAGN